MATDYISRDSILKWIDDSLEQCGRRYTAEQENMMEMFRTVVNDCLPFADVVERKHGSWWKSEDELGEAWMCSECLEEFFSEDPDFPKGINFCPNCGASMRGDDDV